MDLGREEPVSSRSSLFFLVFFFLWNGRQRDWLRDIFERGNY